MNDEVEYELTVPFWGRKSCTSPDSSRYQNELCSPWLNTEMQLNEWIVQTEMAIFWKQGLNDWRKEGKGSCINDATKLQRKSKSTGNGSLPVSAEKKRNAKCHPCLTLLFPLNCTTNPITSNILSAPLPTLSRQINLMKSYEIENCNRHSLHSEICFIEKRGDWISLETFMIWLAIMLRLAYSRNKVVRRIIIEAKMQCVSESSGCVGYCHSIMKIRGRVTHGQLLAELDRAEHLNSTADLSAEHRKSLWVVQFSWPCWPASRLLALHGLLLVEGLARLHQSELNSQRNFRHFDEAPLNQVHIW